MLERDDMVTDFNAMLREADALPQLARHDGFTPEEFDFLLNYDIKYRLGRDSGDAE